MSERRYEAMVQVLRAGASWAPLAPLSANMNRMCAALLVACEEMHTRHRHELMAGCTSTSAGVALGRMADMLGVEDMS